MPLRKVRLRRVSPVAVRSGEGLLSDYTAGIQPAQRELVFMPPKLSFAEHPFPQCYVAGPIQTARRSVSAGSSAGGLMLDWSPMTTDIRMLRSDEPFAVELTTVARL